MCDNSHLHSYWTIIRAITHQSSFNWNILWLAAPCWANAKEITMRVHVYAYKFISQHRPWRLGAQTAIRGVTEGSTISWERRVTVLLQTFVQNTHVRMSCSPSSMEIKFGIQILYCSINRRVITLLCVYFFFKINHPPATNIQEKVDHSVSPRI